MMKTHRKPLGPCHLFTVQGESMAPSYHDGDQLFADRIRVADVRPGWPHVIRTADGNATFGVVSSFDRRSAVITYTGSKSPLTIERRQIVEAYRALVLVPAPWTDGGAI